MTGLGLDSYYLKAISSYCLKKFIDVIPSDFLVPLTLKANEQYIINLSDSNSKGTHFVALSIKDDHIIYFDSFGMDCTNHYIISKLIESRKNLVISKTPIQAINSYFCGYFCLAFLICDQYNHTLKNFLSLFQKNVDQNDYICVHIIKNHIEKIMLE